MFSAVIGALTRVVEGLTVVLRGFIQGLTRVPECGLGLEGLGFLPGRLRLLLAQIGSGAQTGSYLC